MRKFRLLFFSAVAIIFEVILVSNPWIRSRIGVAVNASLLSYCLLQAAFLGNALIGFILRKLAKSKLPAIVCSLISIAGTWYSFYLSVMDKEGTGYSESLINGALGFIFFGFFSLMVTFICIIFLSGSEKSGGGGNGNPPKAYGSLPGIRIYSGYSYDVAFRIDGDVVYSGYSYDVAYRIDGDKIYSGYSYDVAYRIDGDKIYSGYSYDVAYRIDGDKIYSGYSYDVVYRIEQ